MPYLCDLYHDKNKFPYVDFMYYSQLKSHNPIYYFKVRVKFLAPRRLLAVEIPGTDRYGPGILTARSN